MNRHTPEQPNDSLDALLRQWHAENAQRAESQRDQLMHTVGPTLEARRAQHANPFKLANFRRLVMNRYMSIAASLALVATLLILFVPMSAQPALADGGTIMVPEGGKLEALDANGNLIGPCALKHTHVDVNVSGFMSRVTLTQEYHNPYDSKIEAVYTFPMSHRGAVDGFKMVIGDRVVEGEVKEREEARQIYESARESGYVASLLEQERSNIFTQSVANIEPDATVKIEISYIELVEEKDGEYSFAFPMVVGPRYIPGRPTVTHAQIPAELTARRGVILQGPAQLAIGAAGDASTLGTLQAGKLEALLESAQTIDYPGDTWSGKGDTAGGAAQPTLWHRFDATYCDGSKEFGELYTDGTGWINGRWFYFDAKTIKDMGTGFSQDTIQVPDASKVTPMPAKPGTRAGHDISLDMTIDTGGPGIVALKSELHKITGDGFLQNNNVHPSKVHISLANAKEIPNRDFVLSWKQESDNIEEATFTHTGTYGEYTGGFFTLILQPPARVSDWPIRPRELVFVMDTSGSMNGYPIEKSKEVINRAIAAMRPDDTFNIITFAGNTSILWPEPKPATEANRQAAQNFVINQHGGGGTEMMKAINAALVQDAPALRAEKNKKPLTLEELVNLPADGREVTVNVPVSNMNARAQFGTGPNNNMSFDVRVNDDITFLASVETGMPALAITDSQAQPAHTVQLRGTWVTQDGRRLLSRCNATDVLPGADNTLDPMRIVLFLTDGYIGNENEIINAVRANAKTTRVFSFGIGNSVNRMLLDGMAEAGRGEVEYVLLNADADEAVTRLTKRIETPVLTDITLAFSDGLDVKDILPKGGMMPDLFDAKPLVIHGRYANDSTHNGTLTIKGNTGAGPYERTLNLELPKSEPEHKVIATLWARGMVDEFTKNNDVPNIIKMGETFQMMTAHTSFVAVEKSRVTIEGKPVLVSIPVELPDGTDWKGFFGGEQDEFTPNEVVMLGSQLRLLEDEKKASDENRFPWQSGVADKEEAQDGRSDQLGAVVDRLSTAEQPRKQATMANGQPVLGERLKDNASVAGLPAVRLRETKSSSGSPAGNDTTLGRIQSSQFKSGGSAFRPTGPAPTSSPPPPSAATASREPATQMSKRAGRQAGAAGRDVAAAKPDSSMISGGFADKAPASGGGGGFGGGGGTIFADPADSDDMVRVDMPGIAQPLSPDARHELVGDTLRRLLFADAWTYNGGARLRLDWKNDTPTATPLTQNLEDIAMAVTVQTFVNHYKPLLLPGTTKATLELPNHTDFRDSPEDAALLKRLADERITLSLQNATLQAALQALFEKTQLPLAPDWNNLDLVGIQPTNQISFDIKDATLGEALSAILDAAGDELDKAYVCVFGGRILISNEHEFSRQALLFAYDVTNLITVEADGQHGISNERAEELIDLIEESINPDGWRDNGGSTQGLTHVDGTLFIQAPINIHRQVAVFLDALRTALQPHAGIHGTRVVFPPVSAKGDRQIIAYDISALHPKDLPLTAEEDYIREGNQRWIDGFEKLAGDPVHQRAYLLSVLPDLIGLNVEPDHWNFNSGSDGMINVYNGLLVVNAPKDMQMKTAHFLGATTIEDAPITLATGAWPSWSEDARSYVERLLRVLDPALMTAALDARSGQHEKDVDANLTPASGNLRLAVLTKSIDADVLRSIEALGIKVEGSSDVGPLVVVDAPASSLESLAQLETVRKIDPAQLKPAE